MQFCFPLLSLAVLTFLSSFAGMLLLAHLEMTNENFDSLPTARRELRGGGRSTSNEPEPEFFLFLQVAFMILPTIAAIIGTCIYYNKSQNTAPWNGESVQSYPSNKTAVAVPAQQMQILQVQCPAGSKAGDTVQVNGMSVVVPENINEGDTFQVQIPVTPAVTVAPGGAVMNPLTTQIAGPFSDDTLANLSAVQVEQVFDFMEAFTGCERKNRYDVRVHSGVDNDDSVGPVILNIEEQSDTCERLCCKKQRRCVLLVREGDTKSGMNNDVLLQFHKSFGMPQCCCWRPKMQVFDGQATKISDIDDPFACCQMDQKIYSPDGTQMYGASGSLCQIGICFPCCGAVEFDLTDANNEPSEGRVAKVFGGCAELMAGVNKFRIRFPNGATPEQKKALLGMTMFIDYNYFERDGKNNQ